MGESKAGVLRLDFDRRLKLEFHGSKVTSDAGLLPYRELDDALRLTEIAGDVLTDTRRGMNARHGLVAQFRQSVPPLERRGLGAGNGYICTTAPLQPATSLGRSFLPAPGTTQWTCG